ncbi:RHS repeat-associated core domain-containing protein [Streptomyces sp. NPDC002403]
MTSIEPEPPVETANAGWQRGPAWATLPAEPLEKRVDVRSAAAGLDFIRTTEGHLDELTNVLQRMRVLSIQSANGTYSEEDRSAIQIEVDQLTDEIARIADQADFNKMRMLTDASAESNVKAADELGMTPAKINTPASLSNAQASWTLRVHVGANTNEAPAVNIYAANIQHLFAGEAAAPADQGAAAPADQQDGAGAQGGAAVAGPVNVMTAIDANSSIAKIDVAIKTVTDQRSNLSAFSNRLESAIRAANVTDARDKLLAAIGTEAQRVADMSAGQASAALAELTRAYSTVASHEAGLVSLLGFNGERPDPAMGWYLLGNGYRAFNPVLMRFHSPDSSSPFDGGGLNPYAYCLGDPINRVDPTGN